MKPATVFAGFFLPSAGTNKISGTVKEEAMYLLSYEAVLAEETQSGQPDDDLREKQRQLEILNSQIEEKTALLRGREAEMNRLERQLSIKLTDLLVEVERKEMLLREMEGKVRRLERKSRWHVALAR